MVDYNFYINEYKGSAIPNANAFDSLVIEATAFVDTLVFDKSLLQYENILKKYNMAVCSVAEVMNNQASTNGIASESVGNHSVKYSSDIEVTKSKTKKAKMFLQGTGLMSGVMR